MNFKEHIAAGAITSTAVTFVVAVSKDVSPRITMTNLTTWDHPANVFLAGIFLVTLLMSVFPDLDTASIPQRIFYRTVVLVLIALFLLKYYFFFILLSFFSLLPLVHKHRGWTHWVITPWLLFLGGIIAFEYFRADTSFFYSLSIKGIYHTAVYNWHFLLAVVAGHYTHLLLDGRLRFR